MLAPPAPPRSSLRSLRELRSDSRGESEVRSALRARAGTAALLGGARGAPAAGGPRLCHQRRALAATLPVGATTAPARATWLVRSPCRSLRPSPCKRRESVDPRRRPNGVDVARAGGGGGPRRADGSRFGGAMSAAPSSAASGSARSAHRTS